MLSNRHIKQVHEAREAGEEFAIMTGLNGKRVVIPLHDETPLFWEYASAMQIVRKARTDAPRKPS